VDNPTFLYNLRKIKIPISLYNLRKIKIPISTFFPILDSIKETNPNIDFFAVSVV
jgi:hypothetical protein